MTEIKLNEEQTNKFEVKVVWGQDKNFEQSYFFTTYPEILSFIKGIEESNGWIEYDVDTIIMPYHIPRP
tara:strand:- start:258 stop:464 length:207 start_codon:yes stop_codon:yes gene_type:complete